MRRISTILLAMGLLSILIKLPAQDFIMQGCYWDCPSNIGEQVDTASLNFWIKQMQTQAPELSHAGFTFMGLPSLYIAPKQEMSTLLRELQASGLQTFAYIDLVPSKDSLAQQKNPSRISKSDYPVKSFHINYQNGLNPETVASFLNGLSIQSNAPELCITALPEFKNPVLLANWINTLEKKLNPATADFITPRVYDFVLRDALRLACDKKDNYDVRKIYQAGIRDATALSGYNLVTIVNSPFLNDANQVAGDWDDRIADPLLAYAYTLTNNQAGLPAVFYADYYGKESEEDGYLDKAPLNDEIDQLIKAHQQYIFNSTSIEYLNQTGSEQKSIYLSAAAGADSTSTLIFQLDGTNTPAGKANQQRGGKDVIVAINFADTTLQLIQEINMSNLQEGDFFTDILSRSDSEKCDVGVDNEHNVPNAIYIELPPKSYSLWVQGQATQLVTSLISLTTDSYEDFVELNWEVPYEQTTIGYSVERSINGKKFEEIAWINSLNSGTTSASYLFIDDDVFPNETLHYRVKMVDQNGNFEYSTVEATKLSKLEVSFDVTDGTTHYSKAIIFTSNYENQAELTLFNAEGEPIMQRLHLIPKGTSQTEVDLSKLPNGVYFITFKTNDNKSWTTRFLKM